MKKQIKRVKYFTKEKKALISPENKKLYEKYLKSNIIKNKDVKETTYKVYQNFMDQFLVYLAEEWENVGLYDEEFLENAVDIMEGYISFCQDTLFNNKKVINTKISTVSSFMLWSLKRGFIDKHPFDKKLERMKGANEERIINSYYLNDDQVAQISKGLLEDKRYDFQDRLIWSVMLDSANRIGAISKLTLSQLNLEEMMFTDIREKRGYRVEVPFSETTKILIEQWLTMREEMDQNTVDSLFITKYKGTYKPMAYGTIQARIRRIGEILGLKDFHAHCVRKTKLNDIYDKTGDLSLAAEYANHKSTETTRSAYIKPQSKAEVREKIMRIQQQQQLKNS